MGMQSKKSFAMVDYETCNPMKCNPEKGICLAVNACTHKVIKQIDEAFKPPMIFQDMCMGCWDCIDACPLNAIQINKHLS
jgi:translation initiation factor RLI1